MIEVNLLPEDRRPVERTPLPRFLTILVGVVGFCVEAILLVMILADSPVQKDKLKGIERRITDAREQMARIKTFKSRIDVMEKRNNDINDLYRRRRTWAPLLHRMSAPEVLPRNIWYKEIILKQGRPVRGKPAPEELTLVGYARGGSDDGSDSMYQAAQAIDDFVGNLRSEDKDFTGEFAGPPAKDRATEIVELSPTSESPPNVPRQAAAFGIKWILKPKKASGKAGSRAGSSNNRN
ncbi:MAG: PilN domain-containing protein [Planctomycetota bacterium]|jgi:hypothetical protein